MKARVGMPINLYRILVTKCSETSPLFRLLKNAVITPGKRGVILLCEEEEALHLKEWANDCHVGAEGQIKVLSDGLPTGRIRATFHYNER